MSRQQRDAPSRSTEGLPGPRLPRPHAWALLLAAVGVYRRHFRSILVLAVVVFAPAALIDGMASRLLEGFVDDTRGWVRVVLTAVTIVDLGAGIAALTFFAGALDRLVAADRKGRRAPTLIAVARILPWRRLVLADLLVWAFSALAGLFFVLPGLVALTLLSITGPVIIIEDCGPWHAVRRSTVLVWPRFLLAVLLVTVPTVVEEAISDLLLDASVLERLSLALLADVAVAVFVTSMVGVLAVSMAHALILHDRQKSAAAANGSGRAELDAAPLAHSPGEQDAPAADVGS